MVQTSIGNELAFGFPGEHGNGQPFVADSTIVTKEVEFGALGYYASDNTVGPYTASGNKTYTTFGGIVVSPHQHVRQVLPSGESSIVAAVGNTVCVAKKGSWYIKAPTDATNSTLKKGAKIYFTSAGVTTMTGTNNTVLGEVLDCRLTTEASDDVSAVGTVLIRLA